MSGGHFNYAQYRIADIRYEIEDYLDGHPLDECDVESYIKDTGWMMMGRSTSANTIIPFPTSTNFRGRPCMRCASAWSC